MAQIKTLSAVLQKVANTELGEVSSRIHEDLQAFKQWIEKQPHLRARTDDQFLIQFLRGCKYSLERAKEKLDRFYALKTKYPKMFGVCDIDDAKFQEVQSLGCFLFLPIPLHETGPRLVIMRWNYDAKKNNLEEIFPSACALYEMTLTADPYGCINGISYIVDMGNTTMGQYLQFTPVYIKNFITFMEKTIPLRIRKVYIFNLGTLSQQMINMVLPLLSEKLRQKIIFCGSTAELSQHIPTQYLPKEYGGENFTSTDVIKKNAEQLQEYRDYFKQNAQYGCDESLRQGSPLDLGGSFGVGGSFRKIAVD